MNNAPISEVDLLTNNWPKQVIHNYEKWFAVWRESQKGVLCDATEEHYTTVGRKFSEYANGKNLTPRLMLDWHLDLLKLKNQNGGYIKGDRVRIYHFIIKKFLKWLKLYEVILMDPSIYLPEVRMPAPTPTRYWDYAEYRTVVDWAEGKPDLQLYVWLFVLGYHTGFSIKDCSLLRWEEVALRADAPSFIQRIRAKLKSRLGAKAICTVPVLAGGELWRWLKQLEKVRAPGQEYVHRDAPEMFNRHGRDVRRRISEMAKNALGRPIDGKSFRHLRNSFASRLINSGADSVMVSKMTGHQNLEQLASYVIPDMRAMQEAVLKSLRWAENQSAPIEPSPFLSLPLPSNEPAPEEPQKMLSAHPDTE